MKCSFSFKKWVNSSTIRHFADDALAGVHLVTRLSIGNLFGRLHLTVERAFIIRSYSMLNAGTEHAVFNGKAAGLLIAAGRTPVKDIADNNTFILLAGNLTGIDDDITYTISAEL